MNLPLLPHFNRILPARSFVWVEKITLWSLLLLFIVLNSYWKLTETSPYAEIVQSILHHPYSESAHVALAQAYWQKRLLTHAKRELNLAQELYKSSVSNGDNKVLGASITPIELLHQWESEPDILENHYRWWQSVVKNKPDYRDAYLVLAALAFQMGKQAQATEAVSRGISLDPNLPFAQTLLKTIENNQ